MVLDIRIRDHFHWISLEPIELACDADRDLSSTLHRRLCSTAPPHQTTSRCLRCFQIYHRSGEGGAGVAWITFWIENDSNGICICTSLKATNENLPPNVIRQLAKELKNLDDSPPEGIKVSVNDDDFTTIFADIEGPGFFLTKIFHPNIATSGEICVNTLKKDWNPGLGLRHVLLVVRCLLIEPFPESALNEQAGKMLLENYTREYAYGMLYTGIHALKPKNKSKSGVISESTTALNVGQSNTVLGENTLLASAAISTSAAAKALGKNSLDQNAATSDPVVGASGAPKKDAPHAVKVPVDKKKMDARKKSLKRL
ncbi:unnamed protein product [Miscanthus lutarioriparius]|uniref:UBC core domain-containing protein n=1 Tax=Miscanthus lutarioriparius TaxID=422564 RepID=A0A811SD77_9POAL|nr:unnamed protein product [Miscanthus lutarioriparius]